MSTELDVYLFFVFFLVWNIGWHAWLRTRIPTEKRKMVRIGQLAALMGLLAAAVMYIATRTVVPIPFLVFTIIYTFVYYYLGFVIFGLPSSRPTEESRI